MKQKGSKLVRAHIIMGPPFSKQKLEDKQPLIDKKKIIRQRIKIPHGITLFPPIPIPFPINKVIHDIIKT